MLNHQLKYLLIVLLIYLANTASIFADDKSKIDSIYQVLNSNPDDSTLSVSKYNLYKLYRRNNSELEAKKLALEIIDSIAKNQISLKPWEYLHMAYYYLISQSYSKSKEYYLLALEYYQEIDDCNKIAETYGMLSYVSFYQGINNACIDYSHKQYYIAKECGNIDLEIDAITTLGFIYHGINDYERSEKYLNEAYQLAKENNSKYLGLVLSNLGKLNTAKGEYEVALKFHFEALDLAIKNNKKLSLPFIYVYIGNTYLSMGEIDSALTNLIKASELYHENDDNSNLAGNYLDIGRCYILKNDYKNAKKYYYKALQLALFLKTNIIISYSYYSLAELYFLKKDYKRAYEYIKLYKSYNDSVKVDAKMNSLAEMQTKFETERNETQAQILEKEREINKLGLIKKKYILTILTLVAIALVIIAFIVIKRNRIRNRRKIVELKQQNLRNQMNPHFIFNTLNSIQYYLFKNDKDLSNNYLSKFARLLNLIFENSKHKSVSIKDELTALELYLELEKLRFKEKLNYEIKIDDDIDIIDYLIPPLLLQPFVENSILHGIMPKEENGKIKIELKIKNDLITCSIKDNGIGREKAHEIKLGKANSHKSLGTKISEDRLKNLDLLYNKSLKIEYIDVKGEENNPLGTEVLLSFPIIN